MLNIDTSMVKKKIFNDPIYRFMRYDHDVLYRIIDHPYFQRLRRVSQLALSQFVFPGVQHSRYQHALGALHLMTQTIHTLRSKGVDISEEESKGVCIAILLHDIGHGPFSHALEGLILPHSHESISYRVMELIEKDLEEDFSLAKMIYKNNYVRKFLNQLVSSQLDLDRMDYLNRDSFYSGVAEGIIGYDRIITQLNVVNDQLVIEENGIHSVEKFLVARKLMYWQVYLHKAAIGAEQVLVSAIKRCIHNVQENLSGIGPEAFRILVSSPRQTLTEEMVSQYLHLDDIDLLYMLKQGMSSGDTVLSNLSTCIIERKLFTTRLSNHPCESGEKKLLENQIVKDLDIDKKDVHYFLIEKEETFKEYNSEQEEIYVLLKNGDVLPYAQVNPEYLQKPSIIKYALCHWPLK